MLLLSFFQCLFATLNVLNQTFLTKFANRHIANVSNQEVPKLKAIPATWRASISIVKVSASVVPHILKLGALEKYSKLLISKT